MSESLQIPVLNMSGQATAELEVPGEFLIAGYKGKQAVHDAVVALLANRRRGTHSTLTMGEVRGSGKKPYAQKGTGNARAGSFASPLWRGGGVVFGPKPRDYSQHLPRKVKQLALRRVLSERLKGGAVVLIDEIKLASHKTKDLVSWLKIMGVNGSVLILSSPVDKNLRLAARNVPGVEVANPESLHAYDVLRFKTMLSTQLAFEKLVERLPVAVAEVE